MAIHIITRESDELAILFHKPAVELDSFCELGCADGREVIGVAAGIPARLLPISTHRKMSYCNEEYIRLA